LSKESLISLLIQDKYSPQESIHISPEGVFMGHLYFWAFD